MSLIILVCCTYVPTFLVVVNFREISSQTKVSNFQNKVFRYENVSGCQVSMDALSTENILVKFYEIHD